MICIARTFGAPVTVPAGKHARSTSYGDTAGCSSPTTSDTRWLTCESARRRTSASRAPPGAAHPREIVASEVDEHHVLGAVLRRGEQTLDVALAGMGRAGDGADARATVTAGDEALRRRADQREPFSSSRNRYGDGLTRRSARYTASADADVGRSARWDGTIWYASPARMCSLQVRTISS